MGKYIPDRNMVKKIKEYDPKLSVEWNNERQWWEIHYRASTGRKLITPVTQSIYDRKAPIEYAPLDERILFWLWAHDTERHEKLFLRGDQKINEEALRKRMQYNSACRDFAKEMYKVRSYEYVTRHAKRNPKHIKLRPGWSRIGAVETEQRMLRPDSQSRTRSRVWRRSRANALRYNYAPKAK